ncbi:MAG TPA: nuclear transport factor 2 family protein [Arthrobacter sp.]|jgi:hypothetical protein
MSGQNDALTVALAYHEAWTGKNLDLAMSYVSEEIACEAPGGNIAGAAAYRQFLGGFMEKLTGLGMIGAFGDENSAMLMYYPQTAAVSDAPAAEWFSVAGGKIVRTVLVFDRLSFTPPPP